MIMNALVLFGWALILPPMLGDRADIGAPVNEWDVLRKGFATAHDRDEFRANDQVIWQGSGSKPGVVNVCVPRLYLLSSARRLAACPTMTRACG